MIKVMFGVFGGLLLFTHGDLILGEVVRWLPVMGLCGVWLVLGIMKEM